MKHENEWDVHKIYRNNCKMKLIGNNIVSYYNDGIDFYELISRLTKIYPDIDFKIPSIHPAYNKLPELLSLMNDGHLSKHLHLAIQHISSNVLNSMHRYGYDINTIKQVYDLCRKYNIPIELDVIIGYPTESEDDFNLLLNFLHYNPVSLINVFKYINIPGTLSYQLPQLDDDIITSRINKIENELSKNIQLKILI